MGSGELRPTVFIDPMLVMPPDRFMGFISSITTGNTVRPLFIGHGNIREHLRALGSDPDLMICSVLGLLRATWAAVPEHYAEGITKFLADQLDPIIKPILQAAASVLSTCLARSRSRYPNHPPRHQSRNSDGFAGPASEANVRHH